MVAVLFLAGTTHLPASDTQPNPSVRPRLVAAPIEIVDALRPGIDAYNEAHALMRDGRREEAIERGTEAIEYFEEIVRETESPEKRRVAYYYLAHTYLDIIVDMNTWLRFNGDYERVRAILTAYESEEDYRFVEGKRYAQYPPEAGGDAQAALAMFDGVSERYELSYYRAIAMLELGDIGGAIGVLSGEPNLTGAGESLLRRIEVEQMEPRVTSISLPGAIRTRSRVLDRAMAIEVGTPLGSDHAATTVTRLQDLPAVAAVELEYDFDPRRNEVDVTVNVREGKQRMAGVLAYAAYVPEADGLAPDTENSAAMPLLLFNDRNLFGRMVQLHVVTAGVYWQASLGFPGAFGSPVTIETGLESMVLPMETMEFADLSVDKGEQAAWIGANADLGPVTADIEYRSGFSLYDEETIVSGVDVPRDVRHSVTARAAADMRSDIAGGASREGFAVALHGAFTTFSGFDTWGTESVRFRAPDGPGTWTYGIEVDAGWRVGRRGDVGLEVGAYGGSRFFTRALYDVASPGPGSDSALWIRGYPTGTQAERVAVAHGRVGFEVIPGSVHVGAFHDVAAVDVPTWAPEPEGLAHAGGVALSFSLPWSIQMRVSYAHSYTSLDGTSDGGRDVVEVTMMRITAF